MKIMQHNLDDLHVQLDVTASAKEVEQAFDKAQIQFANKMGLQARPGLTPARAAEEQLGIKDLDSVVRDSVIEFLWPYAVEQRRLQPAYPPRPVSDDALICGKDYKFTLPIFLKPRYELTSYEPITLEVEKPEIDYSGVDKTLEHLAGQYKEYTTDEAGGDDVQAGDTLLLKMEVSHEGKKLNNLSFERRPYTLGENYMPESFDKNLQDMKIGETKSFSFDAPAYNEDGTTSDAKFDCTVTVIERQREITPEITDDWVKKYMPAYKTRDELVAEIKATQEQVQLEAHENELRSAATAEVAKRFSGKIDDEVYEYMYTNMLEQLKVKLAAEKIPFDEYTKNMGGEEQMRIMMMVELRRDLVNGYALDAVFRHFKLHAGDAEIDAACRAMNPENPESVRRQMQDSGRSFALRESAERFAAATYLVEHAIITNSAAQSDLESQSVKSVETNASEQNV